MAEHPRTAWLFDVDGVLTNPERKRVTQPAIYDELLARLRRGEPVGLNTGRSLPFIEQVLQPLEEMPEARARLRQIIALGEKGGARLLYGADGARITTVEPRLVVPQALQEDVRALVETQPRFSAVMFFDETKQTMISAELRPERTVAEFEAPQRELVGEMHRLLARHHLAGEYVIDATRIATDIQHHSVGKAYGAARFAEELAARGIEPEHYVCFGDSASDYEMFAELRRRGKPAELIFVGEREHLRGKDTQAVTFTHRLCDHGTLDYLRAHQ